MLFCLDKIVGQDVSWCFSYGWYIHCGCRHCASLHTLLWHLSDSSNCVFLQWTAHESWLWVRWKNLLSQKISITLPQRGFWFKTCHPSGNSHFGSYLPLKFLAFWTPLPIGITNNPPWGKYGCFLKTYNVHKMYMKFWDMYLKHG